MLFAPSIIIVLYFFISPLTAENHEIMKKSLLENFGERCYMSCSLLIVNDINQFGTIVDYMYSKRTFLEVLGYIFRYSLIIIIGFFSFILVSITLKV